LSLGQAARRCPDGGRLSRPRAQARARCALVLARAHLRHGGATLRIRSALGGGVIAAPVLAWQLSRALLGPGGDGRLPVIRPTCDESACCNPSHWVLGTRKDNAADYTARKGDPLGPLTDRRGPAGRARAIRDAIQHAQAHGADRETVDK